MDTLEATVQDTSFRNAENGYTVLQVKDGKKRITVVGALPELASGEQAVFTGVWMEHPQYGRQFKAASVEVKKPSTLSGIERYLGSGLIRGVGPATAKLIVAAFGRHTLDIMDSDPERLRDIPKIGPKRAEMIAESYREQMQTRQAMIFLQGYGISASMAVRISKQYGERTPDVIRQNPYRLIDDVEGIGFMSADRIALSLGIAADSPFRVRSALKFVLMESAAANGHIYLPHDLLVQRACQLLGAARELVEHELADLALSKELILALDQDGTEGVYLPNMYNAEREVARRLMELNAAIVPEDRKETLRDIQRFEKAHQIAFSPLQRQAVKMALEQGVLVITGGPGTGKTTLINCVMSLLSSQEEVILCAPTGRAAKRMSEAAGMEAKTIHRLLEYGGEDGSFMKNQEDPIEADCVIVDEMSMVDLMLMRGLLRALNPGTRLILVGDQDQLPSVGAGNVLSDILKSGAVASVRLTEIFRQEGGSRIVVNAHRINEGQLPLLNEKGTDFFFERKGSQEEAADTIIQLVTSRLPAFLKLPVKNRAELTMRTIQVLAPMKKGDCGVWMLNKRLQDALNPRTDSCPAITYGDTEYRLSDKVMQTKNDYQIEWHREIGGHQTEEGKGVFNGDVGFISSVDEQEHTLIVTFDDDKEVEYGSGQLENLDLAYCLSVHKSQGSEFPAVVMPVVGGAPMLLTRNLFYTALTRARQLVVLVGREEAIAQMVNNNHITRRYTTLPMRLNEMELLIK